MNGWTWRFVIGLLGLLAVGAISWNFGQLLGLSNAVSRLESVPHEIEVLHQEDKSIEAEMSRLHEIAIIIKDHQEELLRRFNKGK